MTKTRYIADLVSASQTVCRIRHGDRPTYDQLNNALEDVCGLLHVTFGERLQAMRELLQRYPDVAAATPAGAAA